MKRLFDIILITIFSPLLIAIFPAIAMIILIMDGRPILYSQKRTGKDSVPFTMYKFRTMDSSSSEELHEEHYNELASGTKIEPSLDPSKPIRIENDVRITQVGNFLRKTSLDELPNLINVLNGQMALVGPRPLVPYESKLYGRYEQIRNTTTPGITGLAQVQGRTDLSLQERLYWDMEYIEKRTFFLDIIILIKTVTSVFQKKGAI